MLNIFHHIQYGSHGSKVLCTGLPKNGVYPTLRHSHGPSHKAWACPVRHYLRLALLLVMVSKSNSDQHHVDEDEDDDDDEDEDEDEDDDDDDAKQRLIGMKG